MFGSSQNGRLGLGEPTHAKKHRAALEAKKQAALRPEIKADGVAPLASAGAGAPNPFGRPNSIGRPLLGGNRGKLLREAALAADRAAAAKASGVAAPAPAPTATAAPAPAPAPAPVPAPAVDVKPAEKDEKSGPAAAAAPVEDVKLDEFYSKPQLVKSLAAIGPVDVVDLGDHHSAAIVKGVLV